jgi:DNA-binding NtrC family response regulator
MPGLRGLDLQESLRGVVCELSIVFIAGQGDVPMGVRAMKAGALDFCSAAEKLKQGDREARFPVGSFPPGLPFVAG